MNCVTLIFHEKRFLTTLCLLRLAPATKKAASEEAAFCRQARSLFDDAQGFSFSYSVTRITVIDPAAYKLPRLPITLEIYPPTAGIASSPPLIPATDNAIAAIRILCRSSGETNQPATAPRIAIAIAASGKPSPPKGLQ